ncbi:hypothetical protein ACF068_04590 [Streptomyces sp. NPDC016309]|uniref:hypothetical protein n=1 Tax=Streptomyces sp. NPDC016309 TaxID=3364965 RepID=UPI0036FBB4D2
MREIVAIIGWVAGIQGVLGFAGGTFGDEPWGLLHQWWEIPTAGYAVIAVLGAVLAVYGETAKGGAGR